ncbi:MAG: TetR/AcrR family transcriptional regulator [Anaerolineae bacterium]|nr:TetR/AcrR family transcriptional regulator [Anaerolineae bacterium]
MEKVDRRVRRTHRLLREALISLSMEYGYDAVSIKAITDRADVAYVTFFRHFRDKDDLLNQMLSEIVNEVENAARTSDLFTEGVYIFQQVQSNADLYRILITQPGTNRVLQQLKQKLVNHLRKHCMPLFQPGAPLPPELALHYSVMSLIALVEWWLEHDLCYSPEQMSRYYQHLITSVLKGGAPVLMTIPNDSAPDKRNA